jgi:hypothetical protein
LGKAGIIDWLRERGFGGREAVAVPRGAAAAGPRGPFPAGVQDLMDFVVSSYAAEGQAPAEQWGFLVGAPGNGKSEAMRELAERLRTGPAQDSERAPRRLSGQINGASVVLINDASIPRDDVAGNGSLARDIEEALEEVRTGGRVLMFANVNRGILVEERNASKVASSTSDVARLLAWLNDVAAGQDASDPATNYYARNVVTVGERRVVVHVLSLDALSLFEPQPSAGERGAALDFSAGDDPVVAPYRPVGGLMLAKDARSSAAAAILIKDVVAPARWDDDTCGSCVARDLCPFRANAAWLADDALRARFLDTFRGAEVAAGRRMTYRDLLAMLATAIIGPSEEEWDEGVHPCKWTSDLAEEGGAVAIGKLGRHRIHASIFPPPNPSAWRRLGKGPIRRDSLYSVVLADFGPDRAGERPGPFAAGLLKLDPSASVDEWEGLRAAVLDAAEAMHVEPSLGTLDQIPAAAVCELDRRIDGFVLSYLQGEAEETAAGRERVPQVRKWRSINLLRHAGLAGGWITDFDAVDAWLVAQEATLSQGSAGALLRGLRRLLIPPDRVLYLAPFRPRTRLFDENLPATTILLAREASEISVELKASRDSLQFLLRLTASGHVDGLVVPVDLDLAREALVVARWNQGFTDLPDQAIARVERVLASLIARKRVQAPPHVTDALGRLFRLRGRWGAHTLDKEQRP